MKDGNINFMHNFVQLKQFAQRFTMYNGDMTDTICFYTLQELLDLQSEREDLKQTLEFFLLKE